MKRKKILIADDHSQILDGIYQTLIKEPWIGNINLFKNGELAIAAIQKKRYDAYIIDLMMPGMDGFDLIGQILEIHPGARIIVNTMCEEVWEIKRMLQAGVQGIVLKSSSLECIREAVEQVLAGEIYFCPRFTHLKEKHKAALKERDAFQNLTIREKEVLVYIVEGKTTMEIAEKLYLTDNAVEAVRKRLMNKLESVNVAHLVTLAHRYGIVKR